MSCAPTRTSSKPSARSKHSKDPNYRSVRSTTTSKPRPRTRLPLHARLLPHLAPQAAWAPLLFKDEHPPINTDPVAKATRSPAPSEGTDQAHQHRRTLPQLQEPARRTRHPHPQHDPPPPHPRDLRQAHPAHPATNPRTRPRRTRPRHHVVTTQTPQTHKNPHRAKNPNPTTRTSG